MFTREQMKEKAVRNLVNINCYKPYKEAYRRSNQITMYEGIGGYYVDETSEPELFEKIHEIENKYSGIVYAVIHNFTEFGELYTMLWQTGYEEDDEYSVIDGKNYKAVYAYVWNKSCDDFSEFGSVGIVERFGGLLRIS